MSLVKTILAIWIAVLCVDRHVATGKFEANYTIQLSLTIQSFLFLADPSPPKWPNAFQVTFVETSTLPVAGTGTNIKGAYYYDYDKKAV